MVKHRFEFAHKCYKKAGSIKKLDEFATFNKHICEGVLRLSVGGYSSALRSFSMATILFPNNKNGYLYQCLAHTYSYLQSRYNYLLIAEMLKTSKKLKYNSLML
jgi:hypothetical protein